MRSVIAISPVAALLATLFLLLRVASAVPVTTELVPIAAPDGNTLAARAPTAKPVISVKFFNDKIKEQKITKDKACLFYYRLNAAAGETTARKWYKDHAPKTGGVFGLGAKVKDPVTYNDVNNKMYTYRMDLPKNVPKPSTMNSDSSAPKEIKSDWLGGGLISQALAESCEGDVYFFTSEGEQWWDQYPYSNKDTNFWWDFEWPALLKNSKVKNVYLIDPATATEIPTTPLYKKGTTPDHVPDKNRPLGTGWEYDTGKTQQQPAPQPTTTKAAEPTKTNAASQPTKTKDSTTGGSKPGKPGKPGKGGKKN
ncbi:hypothetical protein N8T08_005242 [Aspergillus melleus]|uniref:Uncharacterized protein n=1 Tax=Aspergillus melleus TaxID=138277 RepID=A0ACC3BGE6_9EURO|nr:hypothetical protein N8T08_005242 [Aspergillus melleus]